MAVKRHFIVLTSLPESASLVIYLLLGLMPVVMVEMVVSDVALD